MTHSRKHDFCYVHALVGHRLSDSTKMCFRYTELEREDQDSKIWLSSWSCGFPRNTRKKNRNPKTKNPGTQHTLFPILGPAVWVSLGSSQNPPKKPKNPKTQALLTRLGLGPVRDLESNRARGGSKTHCMLSTWVLGFLGFGGCSGKPNPGRVR